MNINQTRAAVLSAARSQVKDAVQTLDQKIAHLARIERLFQLFPDLSDLADKKVSFYCSTWSDVPHLQISVPWDMALCDQICLRFAHLGWTLDKVADYTETCKTKDFRYLHPCFKTLGLDVQVNIEMNAAKEGSKCRLEEVHTTVTQDKVTFKVICEDMLNV